MEPVCNKTCPHSHPCNNPKEDHTEYDHHCEHNHQWGQRWIRVEGNWVRSESQWKR
jgi:hypothetical protein